MGDIKDLMLTKDCSVCRHVVITTVHVCGHPYFDSNIQYLDYDNYPKIPKWCPLRILKGGTMEIPVLTKMPEAPNQGELVAGVVKEPETPNLGELVAEFVDLRDELSAARKNFKEEESRIKGRMETMEAAILDLQRKVGVKSISTETHTAFQTNKTTVRMGDWDTFSKWILDTGNIQCIEKRCAKLACLEIEKEDGIDLSDVGLDKASEVVIQVRKK